jgi:protein associated with RNAse G/E
MRSTRTKYGNKKKIVDGVKFDSQLEAYCYNMLNILKIDFEFQKTIVLIEKFRFEGKAIRETTAIVDFVIKNDGKTIYLDTKGFATEVSKIKYKMLKYQLKDQENNRVVWLHSKKEVTDFINNLKTNQNVNNQQSSITW